MPKNTYLVFLCCISLTLLSNCNPRPPSGCSYDVPADGYCMELGYNCSIVTDQDGSQYAVCTYPDGSECSTWEFYRGECGAEWSWCEQQGGSLLNRVEDMGGFTVSYGVCVFDDGSECLEQEYLAASCNPGDCVQWLMSQDGCVKE